jgi:phosphoheptose isomerase
LSNKKFTSEVKVQRREVRKEIRVLTNDIYHIKDMIACSILKDADVIVCTQTGSYDMTLSRYLTNNNQDDKNLRKGLPR